MKTIINYLTNIQLLALLGGAAFMTGCNNDVSKLGLNEASYRSDKITDTTTFSLRLNNEAPHAQRKQNLTRGETAKRVKEAMENIEKLQNELEELAKESYKTMNSVHASQTRECRNFLSNKKINSKLRKAKKICEQEISKFSIQYSKEYEALRKSHQQPLRKALKSLKRDARNLKRKKVSQRLLEEVNAKVEGYNNEFNLSSFNFNYDFGVQEEKFTKLFKSAVEGLRNHEM